MDTLGKFKTNLLTEGGSFKIGFNNRSPLSQVQYSKPGSSMQHSYNIPKLGSTIGKDGQSILVPDNSNKLLAAEGISTAIGKAGAKIGKAIIEKQKQKPKEENKEKDPKDKLERGSFAQKTLDPEGYDAWSKGQELLKKEKAKESEEKKRKITLSALGVPDFSNFTGTSSDWH